MHKRVLRYTVTINDTPVTVPAGSPVLFGRSDRRQRLGLEHLIDVWFEVTTPDDWPTTDDVRRMQEVQIFGTGHPIPSDAHWLASFIDGPLVWHLYSLRELPAP